MFIDFLAKFIRIAGRYKAVPFDKYLNAVSKSNRSSIAALWKLHFMFVFILSGMRYATTELL